MFIIQGDDDQGHYRSEPFFELYSKGQEEKPPRHQHITEPAFYPTQKLLTIGLERG
jgi:hypothetical protein